MSTTATVTDVKTDVRPEVMNFALQVEQTPDGTDAAGQPKFKTEFVVLTNSKEIDKIKADPDKAKTVVIEQTFGFNKAATPEGFAIAVPDPEERVIIFNAGLVQRARAKATQLLKALDDAGNPEFEPVEGTYDLSEIINTPLQRRNLTPTEKLERAIMATGGLSKEQAAALIAQVLGQGKAQV